MARPPKVQHFSRGESPDKSRKQVAVGKGGNRKLVERLQDANAKIDQMSHWLVPYNPALKDSPEGMARPTIVRGMWLMVILFGVIGVWMSLWPLATGAIAAGRVIVDSNRKEIQHLEGGIVKEILVKEGQAVKKDAVLVRLDNTNAAARQGLLRGQYISAKATEARLLAERDKAESITFPPDLVKEEATDTEVAKNLDSQRRLFQTRKETLQGQVDVLNQKARQSEEEIGGYRQQISSANRQLELLNQEIDVVRQLLSKGNAVKPRLLALERQAAELQGQRGQAQAMVSRANQTINEAKITILNQRTEFLNQVLAELKEVQLRLSDLTEQTSASDDVVRRIEIKAPIDGRVTALKSNTIGGVIRPGDTIMTIVPSNEKLTVEARINPQDIDVVHDGLPARVRLSAYSARYVPPVEGTVVTVSADRFDDANTGMSYFLARIEIPEEEMQRLEGVKLTPGMPAEALIVTGYRTMLSYLIHPIRDSFGRAFREQ
ncbi:MAG: HlyD family type I secretion periplasmic adaptor subunit [Alphaproteobacteria bacterium]|nr:HlyD family type I secretion periplasmic adaptor subunit [Alphaproteobacteria bacterium]